MCGIAGVFGQDKNHAQRSIAEMLDRMPYRGPNDRGMWDAENIALGHLRLSIIDLSEAGHGPMLSKDGRYVISFNGEIYNYIELKKELESLGSSFVSQTDTEVILEAYRHWGENCVEHFNGMWAFALWDTEKKSLFLSRDRFGIKPLFYRWDGNVLKFASEMKCLLPEERGEPNWSYLYHFFDRRTPLGSDQTVFRNILHLRPAHNLILAEGKMRVTRYWEPNPARAREKFDYRRSVETFRELFTDAVRLRLRSDVPVGVCLSGGIDSSVIAMLLSSFGVSLQTFSSTYQESDYSEKTFIDAVNMASGATSHTLTPRSEDFFSLMEEIVHHHDEPVRMPGVFSHWHVMQCAKGHVTVLLDGQGADEIVGGYTDYYPSYLASLLRDIFSLRSPVDALHQWSACVHGMKEYMGGSSDVLHEALARTIPSLLRKSLGASREKELLFSPAFHERCGEPLVDESDELQLLRRFPSMLDREMYRTFAERNLPMLLRYEDRNSMAFSLEARTPFLDYRVVEFCQGLSYREKMRGYTTKWILREAFRDLLPPAIYERRDKKGFPTPAGPWFQGPLRGEVRSRVLSSAPVAIGMIQGEHLHTMLEEHERGERNHERTLFRILTLDMWLHRYAPHVSSF